MHIQAPTPAAAKGLDYNAPTIDSTVNCAGSVSSVGGQCVQTPASATAPTRVDSAAQPDAPAAGPGTRLSTGSTPRREPHSFLMTENALAYAKDPRMEGLHVAFDEEWPSAIQDLPYGVFLTPREKGASLQEEYLSAHYATKQLRNGELIRRVCDNWNYNSANSYTPKMT